MMLCGYPIETILQKRVIYFFQYVKYSSKKDNIFNFQEKSLKFSRLSCIMQLNKSS